jgi:hypothetical protein
MDLWFGALASSLLGVYAIDAVTRTWGVSNHPSWGLKASTSLIFFGLLRRLESMQNFNQSTGYLWILREGYLFMTWIMAHTVL